MLKSKTFLPRRSKLQRMYSKHYPQNQPSMSRQPTFINEGRCMTLFMCLKTWVRSL